MGTYFFDIDDFIFDSTTKRYKIVFNASRLQKIRHIVFESFHYTNSTTDAHMILVHSDLCKSIKRHRFYKGSSHNNRLDVLFSLQETHSQKRFILKNKRIFDLDQSIFGFEIWFTDHDLVNVSAPSSNAVVPSTDVTSDDIVAEFTTDLVGFIDLDSSRTLDVNFAQCSTAGDDVVYLHSRQNTELVMSVAYATSMKLSNFNSSGTMKSVTSDVGQNWQSIFDNLLSIYNSSYIPGPNSVICIAFKLTGNTFVQLVEHTMFKIFFSAGLKFKDVQGVDVIVQNISIIPLQPYFLVCERDDANNAFIWTVTHLDTGAVQNATTICGAAHTTLQTNLRFGRANTSFTHHMSVFVFYNNPTAARKTLVTNYALNLYDSNSVVAETPAVHKEQMFFELSSVI